MKKALLFILVIVFVLVFPVKAQYLAISMFGQVHSSNLGTQVDPGFASNAIVSVVWNRATLDFMAFRTSDLDYQLAKTFDADNFALALNGILFRSGNLFSYLGGAATYTNQTVKINGQVSERNLMYGFAVSYGVGAEIGKSLVKLGVLGAADFFGTGDKRRYTMLYVSLGVRLYSFKKSE